MERTLSQPQVSVVLPVYNGAAYVGRAIASILVQTFTDFELIAIDDGSTDATPQILDRIADPRLRVVHQDNRGLSATLNRGLELARGRYVARQDHDDLSRPERLASQVAFLDAHPACGLVGTRAEIWVGDVMTSRVHDHPLTDAALRFELLFDNPFVHSSVMLRKTVLETVGGYSTDPARRSPEDYELWSRIARHAELANLPERLLVYREVQSSLSRLARRPFVHKLVLFSSENLAYCLGASTPTSDMVDVAALTHWAFDRLSDRPSLERMLRLVTRAAERIDPRGTSSELARLLELHKRSLRRRYRLRGRLAQSVLELLRASRQRLRASLR